MPILTARLPVERIKERWATYAAGIDAGGHDAATVGRVERMLIAACGSNTIRPVVGLVVLVVDGIRDRREIRGVVVSAVSIPIGRSPIRGLRGSGGGGIPETTTEPAVGGAERPIDLVARRVGQIVAVFADEQRF